MSAFSESIVEDAALAWLKVLGYSIAHGPHVAQAGLATARTLVGVI